MHLITLALALLIAPPVHPSASAIEKHNAELSAAAAAGDAGRIAALYHPNVGILMPPNVPAQSGRDDIRRFWQGFLAQGHVEVTLTTERILDGCDIANEVGRYSLTITPAAGGTVIRDSGKYSVVWIRNGEDWLIGTDIFNSNGAR